MACAAGRGLDLDARARPTTAGCKLGPRRAFATGDRVHDRCVAGRSRRLLAVFAACRLDSSLQCFRAVDAAEAVRMYTGDVGKAGGRAFATLGACNRDEFDDALLKMKRTSHGLRVSCLCTPPHASRHRT